MSHDQSIVHDAVPTCEHESEALRIVLSERHGFGQVKDLALSGAETSRDVASACTNHILVGEAILRGRLGSLPS